MGILTDNQSLSPAKGGERGERDGLSCRNDTLSPFVLAHIHSIT